MFMLTPVQNLLAKQRWLMCLINGNNNSSFKQPNACNEWDAVLGLNKPVSTASFLKPYFF